MVYTRSRSHKKIQKRFCLEKALGIFLVVILFSYIIQINGLIGQSLTLKDLNKKLRVLQSQNQELQLKASELALLSQKQAIQERLDLVPIEKVSYIRGTSEVSWK